MFTNTNCRPAKRILLLVLAFLFWFAGLTLPVPNKAEASSYRYNAAPKDVVGVARPTISFLFDADLPDSPTSAFMYLNGQEVPVSYDKTMKTYSYTPTTDLAPGVYTVRMYIRYEGYMPIEQTWTFTVAKDALKQLNAATPEQLEGFAALNDYRTLYGLPTFVLNDRLNASASAHAKYLAANKVSEKDGVSLHDEDAGGVGFIGKTPSERAAYFGYTTGAGEDAAYYAGTINETIDALFDAPYHRSPFLNPFIKEVGIGKADNYTIIEFGMEPQADSALVVSPAPGDRYAPTAFEGNETPDPLRIHPNDAFPVGYPIMAQYFGSGVKNVKLLSAELLDNNRKPVDLLVNTPDTDDKLKTAVILLPRKPLKPDTSYHVKLKLQAVKEDGSATTDVKEWDFTTEPISGIGKKKLHQNANDYRKFYVNVAPLQRVASFGLDDTSYSVDGISFPMKRPPVIVDGFSYLYIRDLAAALGANVDWDEQKRAAVYTKGNLKVTLYTTKNEYEVNGKPQQTDTPARLIGENTMVPVRLLAEVLGAKVDYIDASRTVKIAY